MIDIENEIFTAVATELRSTFTDIFVSGEYVSDLAKLPAVFIGETDNYAIERTMTAGENHATLTYEINAFSNKAKAKKAECKAIMATVDTVMAGLGFIRTSMLAVPNFEDATIYRMVARYTAIVGTDKTIFRR